jgi:hypothetical protein
LQTPPAQFAEPDRLQAPRGPDPPPFQEQEPPAQLLEAPQSRLPRGPVKEPLRVQASASETAAKEISAAKAVVAIDRNIPNLLFLSPSMSRREDEDARASSRADHGGALFRRELSSPRNIV